MNKNPDVEVKLARFSIKDSGTVWEKLIERADGEFCNAEDALNLLESKDARIQELKEAVVRIEARAATALTTSRGIVHSSALQDVLKLARTLLSEEPTLDALSKTGGEAE